MIARGDDGDSLGENTKDLRRIFGNGCGVDKSGNFFQIVHDPKIGLCKKVRINSYKILSLFFLSLLDQRWL